MLSCKGEGSDFLGKVVSNKGEERALELRCSKSSKEEVTYLLIDVKRAFILRRSVFLLQSRKVLFVLKK